MNLLLKKLFLPGYPLSQNVATFQRGSVAYLANGSQVDTGLPCFESACYGQGIQVEESTINYLSENQSSIETDTTGFNAYGGGSTTLTRDITEYWTGNASLKAVTDGGAAEQGFTTTSITVVASQSQTASVWLKGTGTVYVGIQERDAADAYVNQTISAVITLNSTWQRVSVTRVFGASGVKARLIVYAVGTQTITFYADGLQIEQNKAYATNWHLGGATRNAETLTIPTANVFNRAAWSVEMVFRPTSNPVVTGVYRRLWRFYINESNYYNIILQPDGRLRLHCRSGGVDYSTYIGTETILQINTDYHVCATGRTDILKLNLFVNGAQYGTANVAYVDPVGTLPADMYVGSIQTGTFQANGIYNDLRISNVARSLADHQAAYNRGRPLRVDRWTVYKASFDGHLGLCRL